MPSAAYDLHFLQVALVDIQGYLLSDEIYWPVVASQPAGDPPYPRLTLGSILLSVARLQASRLSAEQKAQFDQLSQRLEEARRKWQVAWEKKAAREFGARLTLWRNFLEDYREDPEANVDRYDYEVMRRVMLHMLGSQPREIPSAELELLSGMDRLLRAVFVPGDFIWEPELQDGFPKETYWYLYGRPKQS